MPFFGVFVRNEAKVNAGRVRGMRKDVTSQCDKLRFAILAPTVRTPSITQSLTERAGWKTEGTNERLSATGCAPPFYPAAVFARRSMGRRTDMVMMRTTTPTPMMSAGSSMPRRRVRVVS